jgi:hypothetical protein
MPQFNRRLCRLGAMSVTLAMLGGCASFDFGGSGGEGPGAVGGASGGTQVVGTQLISVPTEDWSNVLNNQSGQRLRLFVTLWGKGPLELRGAPAAAPHCAAAATLARRGAGAVLVLDKGCSLQAQSRGEEASLLRVQTEGPKLEP